MQFEFTQKLNEQNDNSEELVELRCESDVERTYLGFVMKSILEAAESYHIDESRLEVVRFFLNGENRNTMTFLMYGEHLDLLADMAEEYGDTYASSGLEGTKVVVNQLGAARDLRHAALSIPNSLAELV